jgi:hypothetical protein
VAKDKAVSLLELPVAFGGLSVGERTVRLAVSIGRANISVNQADKAFTDMRITCKIKTQPKGDAPGQTTLAGMAGTSEIEGVADVKGIKAGGTTIGIGLTFSRRNIDIEELSHFVRADGQLIVTDIAKLSEEESGDDDDEDAEDEEDDEDDD